MIPSQKQGSFEVIEQAPTVTPAPDMLRDCPSGEVKPIVFWPDDRLFLPSETVEHFDEELSKLVSDMATTMYMTGGNGLAAVQIGIPKRVFIVDIYANVPNRPGMPRSQLLVVINPSLVVEREASLASLAPEACLSAPGVKGAMVQRYETVNLHGWDRHGNRFFMNCSGQLGRAVQHEYDHLDGIMFFDRMNEKNRGKAIAEAQSFRGRVDKRLKFEAARKEAAEKAAKAQTKPKLKSVKKPKRKKRRR